MLHQQREGHLEMVGSGAAAGVAAVVEEEATTRLIRRHLIQESHTGKKGGGPVSGPELWAERQRAIWRAIEGTGNKICEEAVGGWEVVITTAMGVDHLAGPAPDPVSMLDMRAQALDQRLEDR